MAVQAATRDKPGGCLARAAQGNGSAIADCMSQYGQAVWSLCLRLSPTRADAEDATQEIFLDVWRSAGRFDAAKGSELSFIMTIARRRLIDRLRRRNARPITEPEEFLPASEALTSPDASPEINAEVAVAVRALESLKAEQAEVIKMSVYKGLTHREIAEITGKPLGTVKTLIRRGLMQVREILADEPNPASDLAAKASQSQTVG